LKASLYEFNEAAKGYYRNWEKSFGWMTRELRMELIMGNPNYEKSSKPTRKEQLYNFSTDEIEQIKKINPKKIQQDLRVIEQAFNK
jgi:hypothetical protein